MTSMRWKLIATTVVGMGVPAFAQETTTTTLDHPPAVQFAWADSTIDSLRAEIRKLNQEMQQLKQNHADGGDLQRLLEALAEPEPPDAAVPEDTRSRRQRVDILLKAITQRPGQLRLHGGATAITQGLVGGTARGAAGTGSLDIYASTSFGPASLLFFDFEAASGEGLSNVLPLTAPINADAAAIRTQEGYDLLVLREAWAEFTGFGEAVIFTVGKIDLTNYFDINEAANDETSEFLSAAFVNSSALAVPIPGPGLRARTVLLHRFSLQVGLSSSDSTGGTRFEDVFVIGAVGLRLFPEASYAGNVRVYVYEPPSHDQSSGWGLSFDQHPIRELQAFGRFGRNNADRAKAFPVASAWSAGLAHERTLGGRRLTIGTAYGSAELSAGGHERTFETYVSWQLNPWTFVSPHLQIVRSTREMARPATVLGVRFQFDF